MHIDRPISIALIFFVILLLVFFWVAPEYATFTKLQSRLGESRAEFNAEFDYYAAITRIYYDLQSRQDDIKKIDDALPSTPDLGRIIYYLQQPAAENGLVVKDLFLSKSSASGASAKKANSIKDLVFSMDLLGSYPAIESFIVSLEKASRIFEVISISFGSETVASSQSQSQSQAQALTQQIYSFNLQIKTNSY